MVICFLKYLARLGLLDTPDQAQAHKERADELHKSLERGDYTGFELDSEVSATKKRGHFGAY